ncbi:MAG: radical SAM protein [Polyangiales bacterium]
MVTAVRASMVEGVTSLGRRALPVLRLGAGRALGRKSPFQMTLSLTNRCNFRCEYCHIPLQRRDEMTTAEWRGAIDDLRGAGMGRASLIGGEPLLRKDAGEIIAHLRQQGVHAAMNTNGWFVADRLEDVARLDLVCLTLDGPREVHDAQRHAGSYDRVIDAIERLRRRGVPVVTMTVLTPRGIASIDHVLDVATSMGFTAYFQLEHDADVDVLLPVARRTTDAGVAAVARALLAQKRAGRPVGNSVALLEVHLAERYLGRCDGCFAGMYYGYVMSDGTVAPCLLTQSQVPQGNGRDLGFARAFEALAAPTGPGCACLPTHAVNRVLEMKPTAIWEALSLALASRLR